MSSRLVLTSEQIYRTIYGESYKIVKYINSSNVLISYIDNPDCVVKTYSVSIRSGNPPNPYRPVICGRGFHGEGYPISINNEKTLAYVKWHGILSRCYGINHSENHAKAIKCYADADSKVDLLWFNYQKFTDWFTQELHSSNFEGKVVCLDSDLLNSKGDLYSDKTCCLLPYELNIAIQLSTKMRYDFRRNRYYVKVTRTVTRQSEHVGIAYNEKDAWEIYSKFKDQYIKDAYQKLQCKLPERVEHALLNFNCIDRVKELGYLKI